MGKLNTVQNGKNSKNRLKGESQSAYYNSRLWDNLDKKKKEALMKVINAECQLCGHKMANMTALGLYCVNTECENGYNI